MYRERLRSLDVVVVFAISLFVLFFLKRPDFFTSGLVPINDFAANDLIIQDAKTLSLLHGNYSRVGFYHPGPFFFQWMAFAEILLCDWLGWFSSPIGAHIFGGLVLNSIGFALLYQSYRVFYRSILRGLLATALTVTVAVAMINTHDFYLGKLYFSGVWPPFLYMTATTFVLAGLVGAVARGRIWLPTLVSGLMMLIHGHASFIGLVPIMCFCMVLTFVVWNKSLPSAWSEVLKFCRGAKVQLGFSLFIFGIFMLPILMNTILNWPGEIPKYFAFSEKRDSWSIFQLVGYFSHFFVWPLLVLPVFLSNYSDWRSKHYRLCALLLLTILPASVFYADKGLDILDYKYPLFWMCILFGGAVSVAVMSMIERCETTAWRYSGYCMSVGVAVWVLASYNVAPFEFASGKEFYEAVNALEKITAPGKVTWLKLDQGNAKSIVYPITLASIERRQGHVDFCIDSESWSIAFTDNFKCKNPAERSTYILLRGKEDGHGPEVFESLGLVGYQLPPN